MKLLKYLPLITLVSCASSEFSGLTSVKDIESAYYIDSGSCVSRENKELNYSTIKHFQTNKIRLFKHKEECSEFLSKNPNKYFLKDRTFHVNYHKLSFRPKMPSCKEGQGYVDSIRYESRKACIDSKELKTALHNFDNKLKKEKLAKELRQERKKNGTLKLKPNMKTANFGIKPSDFKYLVKSYMDDILKDPTSVKYKYISKPEKSYYIVSKMNASYNGKPYEFVRTPKYGWRVCVRYMAKNSYGAYNGYKTESLFIKNGKVFSQVALANVCKY